MIAKRSCLGVVLISALLSVRVTWAAEPTSSVELDVHQVTPADAVPALRALAGIRVVAVVDENTVKVQGTAEELEIARIVIELLNEPADTEEAVTTRELADGTAMARFVLRQASTDQVTSALRKIPIAKFAVNKSAATVIVRDTKEQVETALDLIAAMERGGS